MAQYSKIAEGYFTATAATPHFVNLPFVPNTFEIWNETQWGSNSATPQVQYGIGFAENTAGTAYVQENVASQVYMKNIKLTSGGFSFVSAGTYQYGPTKTITGITQANPAVVTVTAHGYSTGDSVLIYGTTGMLQVAGVVYTITKTGADTFTIDVDSSGFAAAASAGFCKQLLYPDLYEPEGSVITAITTGATTTITTAINHNFVVGQEVFFVVPSAWGTSQLDTKVYNAANVVPQQAYVISVTANTIVINVNSTGYTAFAYPTSATAALGLTFPQVYAIGDANTGYSAINGNQPPSPITIPGAYFANTRQGVTVGAGLLLNTSDVIRWRAVYPDLIAPND